MAIQDWGYLSRLRRYECRECGRWFNDRSGTFLERSRVRFPKWTCVLRELDKGRSINSISEDLPHTYRTVHGMVTTIREAIYQRREEWREGLTGEVEADDVHRTLGQQGRTLRPEGGNGDGSQGDDSASEETRDPRARGLCKQGRGSWTSDRPPAVLWVERNGPERVLELQPDVTQHTLARSAARHVEPGSRIDTDDFSGYGLLGGAYDHRSVGHEETYVIEEGAHCNTAEGEWSIFNPDGCRERVSRGSKAPCVSLPQRVFLPAQPPEGDSPEATPPAGCPFASLY